MTYCLKDVHLFHKWSTINRELKGINLEELNLKPEYTEIDTMGSVACQGGACELPIHFLEKMKNK
jgi:ribonucleoside-diphosphate reductase alpha chain